MPGRHVLRQPDRHWGGALFRDGSQLEYPEPCAVRLAKVSATMSWDLPAVREQYRPPSRAPTHPSTSFWGWIRSRGGPWIDGCNGIETPECRPLISQDPPGLTEPSIIKVDTLHILNSESVMEERWTIRSNRRLVSDEWAGRQKIFFGLLGNNSGVLKLVKAIAIGTQ